MDTRSDKSFRWATIPVVKVAQEEKIVDFPEELDVPWPFLQRNFGVTAESGNNTANVLHNFNEKGERVYEINVGMSDVIRSSEDVFFRMFYNLEILVCINSKKKHSCLILKKYIRPFLFIVRWSVPSSASRRRTRRHA